MIEGKPVTIPGAISFTVDSKHVNDQFEIRVFQPPPYPQAASDMGVKLPDAYRILYTLDANMGFASVVANTSVLPGDPDGGPSEFLIVVGIGYPVDDGEGSKVAVLRARDMTPPGTPEPPEMEMFKQMARLEERKYKGLDWSAQEFENESHMSYVNLALSHGLRRLFPGQPGPVINDVRK